MSADCWITSANVRSELRAFFHEVNRGVSSFYEDNPSTREEMLDGRFAERVTADWFDRYRLRIEEERRRARLPSLRFQFAARHVTHREHVHGADLGFVVRIACPQEIVLTKAVTVQSRRLHGDRNFSEHSTYRQLFTSRASATLQSQSKRMLDLTPASVYLFYNPERLRIQRRIRELGLRVLSAQVIEGMENASRPHFTARDSFEQGLALEEWFVDRFICCNTGDAREDVVLTALGDNSDFPVRNVVEIFISSDGADTTLFDRP